jgi:hypothetical protein
MDDPTPQPATLASADPGARLDDLRDLAAGALERLAREQDAAAGIPLGFARSLATSRGEAARAVEALRNALPPGAGAAFHNACVQSITLRSSAPIPSATLREWAAAWRTGGVS